VIIFSDIFKKLSTNMSKDYLILIYTISKKLSLDITVSILSVQNCPSFCIQKKKKSIFLLLSIKEMSLIHMSIPF